MCVSVCALAASANKPLESVSMKQSRPTGSCCQWDGREKRWSITSHHTCLDLSYRFTMHGKGRLDMVTCAFCVALILRCRSRPDFKPPTVKAQKNGAIYNAQPCTTGDLQTFLNGLGTMPVNRRHSDFLACSHVQEIQEALQRQRSHRRHCLQLQQ